MPTMRDVKERARVFMLPPMAKIRGIFNNNGLELVTGRPIADSFEDVSLSFPFNLPLTKLENALQTNHLTPHAFEHAVMYGKP